LPRVNLLNISGLLAYGALIGSVGAVAGEAPPGSMIVFILALLAGFIQDQRSIQNPISNPLFLLFLVVLGIFLSLIGISGENFFNRFLSILLIIISAKLISPKKSRDMLQIYLLNLLVVAAAAVTRWGMEFGLLVILEAFISVTGLVLIYGSYEQQEISTSDMWHLVRWSGLITLCLLPVTIVFFIILPRPAGIFFAWGGGAVAKTGFSDRVTPGSVERIKIDPSPAFRVRWLEGKHPPKPLWRGIVYDTYEGGVWEKRYKRAIDFPKMWVETMQYEILLEPTDSKYLLSLGLPGRISLKSQNPILVSGYTGKVPDILERRTLYQVHSYSLRDLPDDLSPRYYLDIPDDVEERLLPLARRLAGQTVMETARGVESFLKTEFTYNLAPGEAQGDPVIYFLFTNKKGHCEYFASAMVLLLRSLGIPARLVGGYSGGDWNEMGEYYLVHHSDAHTWVEVWVEGRGWVVFDPTPAVYIKEKSPFRVKISRLIDFLKLKWYYWVLDYDLKRQADLAHKAAAIFQSFRSSNNKIKLAFKALDFKKLIPIFIIACLILFLKMAWPRFYNRPKTWGERFVHFFQRHGYYKQPEETLQEFAQRIAEHDPPLGHRALLFVKNYYLLEYGQKGHEEILGQLLNKMGDDLKSPIHLT